MLDILIFDSLLWRQKEAVRQGYEGYYYNINKKDGVVLGNADLNSKGWADKVTERGGLNLNLSNEKGDKQLPKYAYLLLIKQKLMKLKETILEFLFISASLWLALRSTSNALSGTS